MSTLPLWYYCKGTCEVCWVSMHWEGEASKIAVTEVRPREAELGVREEALA